MSQWKKFGENLDLCYLTVINVPLFLEVLIGGSQLKRNTQKVCPSSLYMNKIGWETAFILSLSYVSLYLEVLIGGKSTYFSLAK